MSDFRFEKRIRGRLRGTVGSGLGISGCEASATGYARNLLLGTPIAQRGDHLAHCDDDDVLDRALQFISGRIVGATRGDSSKRRARLLAAVKRSSKRPVKVAPPGDPIGANLSLVAELVGLDAVDLELLQFLVIHRMVSSLEMLTDVLGALPLMAAAAVIGAAIARPREEVLAALAPRNRLVGSGLVRIEEETNTLEQKVIVSRALIDIALFPSLDRAQLLDRLLPMAPPATLAKDDFSHLAAEVAVAGRLLVAALEGRRPGINVLFYGATGSGKTELARLLAETAGSSLHVAGKEDEEGSSPTAEDRLASLLLGNRLLASGRSLLLFDELEDVFERGTIGRLLLGDGRARPHPSKQWFNLLLESNPVPTIWISNDVSGMDSAFLRRFSYAIEFRPLGVAQRQRVWKRHLGAATGLAVSDMERLAERFTVSAGQIATSVSAARLVAGGEPDRATIEQLVSPLEKLVLGKEATPNRLVDGGTYLFEAANASCDLRALADRLAQWQPGERAGLSLCLYGPPGTGKSEFVHHLGRRMGRRVIVRRVSDIQSPWLGVAEQNLAEAFREAAHDGAVLLFDEADSFLRDRRGAQHSWEVSQVNEFLQQLEAHRGVVACTTNLWRDLDQASLRRFVFKIELRFVTTAQALLLFRTLLAPLLGCPPLEAALRIVERELERMANLTPGDFAAVARRVGAIYGAGAPLDALALVDELRAEVAAKEGSPRSIGF